MFKIDLLKGEGIPERSRPENIAVVVIVITLPLLVGLALAGRYLQSTIQMAILRQEIISLDKQLERFQSDLEYHKKCEAQKNQTNKSLADVARSLDRYTQWTPVLKTVVENLPKAMILTQLDTTQRTIRKQVPHPKVPDKVIQKDFPVNLLNIKLSGNPNRNWDRQVREFTEKIKASEVMGSQLESVRISQETELAHGEESVVYTVGCTFKAKM